MTTIESANRIVWFTASSSIRRASGSCTFATVCQRVDPIAAAASTVITGTPRMPSAVMRIDGGMAQSLVESTAATGPTEKGNTTVMMYANDGTNMSAPA